MNKEKLLLDKIDVLRKEVERLKIENSQILEFAKKPIRKIGIGKKTIDTI
tara:strand:+ start:937 stop:1086 length:150 start_codon:yes stop_codon:yes gene_type:complete